MKHFIKISFIFITIFSILTTFIKPAFSQETNIDSDVTESLELNKKKSPVSAFMNIGLNIMVNTEKNDENNKAKSAVTPVLFSLAVGAVFPNWTLISFQPRLAFFASYYFWDGKNALPTEVENRTALALSFLIDLPATFTFRLKKSQIECGAGVAFLARIGLLAPGVRSNDEGETGDAQGDLKEINAWFYKSARFLYPEIFVAWEYFVTEKLKAGLEARYYLPIGSLSSGRALDASMIYIGAKFIF